MKNRFYSDLRAPRSDEEKFQSNVPFRRPLKGLLTLFIYIESFRVTDRQIIIGLEFRRLAAKVRVRDSN